MTGKSSNSIAYDLIAENIRTGAKFLDLGNCRLSDNSDELKFLQGLDHLESINLGTHYYVNDSSVQSSNNSSPNAFSRIPEVLPPNLKELYIAKTGIKTVQEINLYKYLVFFDGYGNFVEQLPTLQRNEYMVSFGISGNALTNIDELCSFPNLKSLYIGGNKIDSINLKLQVSFPLLHTLYAYANQLKDLSFLRNNKSLRLLEISNNKLESIGDLAGLTWLEEVNIANNPIRPDVPKEIISSRLGVMLRSWLRNISLPASLTQDNKIKKEPFLDLGYCGTDNTSKDWSLLKQSPHLLSLNMGNYYFDAAGQYQESLNPMGSNNLPAIPKDLPGQLKELQSRESRTEAISNIDHLKSLELLDLSHNLLENIGNLSYLGSLKELALHANKITSIETAVFPPQLKILHLSANKLTSLNGIEKCTELEELIVYDNKIETIRPATLLPKLRKIEFVNNPITDCPSEIWTSNDIQQIRDYFAELDREQSPAVDEEGFETLVKPVTTDANASHDVKLIILGNSGCGKTHLVHYLETGTCLNQRNSTHGLEVKRWRPDVKRFPQLKDVEISVWDFGGQEYYHEAYKLFLGTNAVYVIMWSSDSDFNGKKDELLKDTEPKVPIDHFEKQYWLDTIKCFRGENNTTPLLMVQNKVDLPATQKIRVSQELHDEYSINESFHISILNGCDPDQAAAVKTLENFTHFLADSLSVLAHRNAQFSDDFKYIRNQVLNLGDPKKHSIFSGKSDLDITKAAFDTICTNYKRTINPEHYPVWLHNGGALVYFANNMLLKDRIFINPRKLSEKIYAILNNQVLASNGEIQINTIPPENEVIVQVMKSLEMIYQHPTKETHYLAPQYLPEEHPIEELFKIASVNAWQDSFWIKVPMFFYKKLMHYLLLKYISLDTPEKVKYFWKNGIILLKDGKRILIKGLYANFQPIKSTGPGPSGDTSASPIDKNETVLPAKEGIIQISVEENSADLQKEIFKTILGFRIQGNGPAPDAASPKSPEAQHRENSFIKKLQISVNKRDYVLYIDLLAMSGNTATDANSQLLQYNHIVDLDTNGKIPKNIFVSYSHSNTIWLSKIKNHLAGLRRSNLIKEWTDQEILAGDKWDDKIKEQIKRADIFILLLSAEFIASEYIWKVELREAFESKKTIIPIYIESFDFAAMKNIQGEKINNFEIIPKDQNQLKPVNLWTNEAQALATVASRIREVIENQQMDKRQTG